jgi:hypothetical protein
VEAVGEKGPSQKMAAYRFSVAVGHTQKLKYFVNPNSQRGAMVRCYCCRALATDNVVGRLRKTAQGIPISRRLLEAHIAETERTIANSEEEIRAISARQPDTADQAAAERQTRRAAVLVTL